jgi:cell division protein FtsQ
MLVAAGGSWLARQPYFMLQSVRIDGEVARTNPKTVLANASHELSGSYFTLDLGRARDAFEAVPWVRHAVVQRVWPNRLVVQLEEHRPAALWQGEEGAERLVNSHGEIFDANLGDVDEDKLPAFSGPKGSAPQMLQMLARLRTVLAPLDATPARLALSGRGSWRVELDSGMAMELGRGPDDEVIANCERYVRTQAQVLARHKRPIESVDLRHAGGYAVRFKSAVAASAPTNNTAND